MSNEIEAPTSPYADRKVRHSEHIAISAFWFSTNFLWGALLVLMLPNEIKEIAPFYRVTAVGVLTAISALVALSVPLVVGALSDRCTSRWGRRRPFIAFGVLVNLVGLAMMGLVFQTSSAIPNPTDLKTPGFWATVGILLSHPSFTLFLLAYIVVQLGNNIASAAYMGVIPDLIPADQRGAASGYMALMSQAGTLFGVVVVAIVLGGQPEWMKYVIVGGVLGATSLVTIFGTKEAPLPTRPPALRWIPYLKSLWIDPKRFPDFAWVWITRALVMLGFYSVLPYINYYLIDVIGIAKPDTDASILMAAILVASSISGVYGGLLSDRVGRKKVVYIANMIIAVMALSFIFCRNFAEVLVAGTFFGLGFGAYTSVDWALGTDVLPTQTNAAKEMAVWHIAMTLPQSIAPIVAAYLIALNGVTLERRGDDQIPHYGHLGYAYVFILCAVCFALGAYLLRNVRKVN